MNKTEQHTKGAWHTEEKHPEWIFGADGLPLAYTCCECRTKEIREANARVISAVPHMLGALEAIHAALNQPVHHSENRTPETADVLRMDATIARNMAMAAIKKALGGL
jgi:hypothetical protein